MTIEQRLSALEGLFNSQTPQRFPGGMTKTSQVGPLDLVMVGSNADGTAKVATVNQIGGIIAAIGSGGYKGPALADTNPGIPTKPEYWSAKAGVTYPNFKDANGAAISIPSKVGEDFVITAALVYNGTNWVVEINPVEIDLVDYAKKADMPTILTDYAKKDQILALSDTFNGNPVFLMSCFTQDKTEMFLAQSPDGVNWSMLKNTSVYVDPNGGQVRDPSIVFKEETGVYYCTYTPGTFGNKDYFPILYSRNLINWTLIGNYTAANVPAVAQRGPVVTQWAPDLFLDDDGTMYCYFALGFRDTGYKKFMYVSKSLNNNSYNEWSAPQEVQFENAPTNGIIDGTVTKDLDGTYVMLYKDEADVWIEQAVSNTPDGTFIGVNRGNWAGWGQGIFEGSTVVRLEDRWRIYFDAFNGGGVHYSDNILGLTTPNWSPPARINDPMHFRHGTVIVSKNKKVTTDISSVSLLRLNELKESSDVFEFLQIINGVKIQNNAFVISPGGLDQDFYITGKAVAGTDYMKFVKNTPNVLFYGQIEGAFQSGTTAQRPAPFNAKFYFDKTIGKLIIFNDSPSVMNWVDSDGNVV
jgi:hypothetical protein